MLLYRVPWSKCRAVQWTKPGVMYDEDCKIEWSTNLTIVVYLNCDFNQFQSLSKDYSHKSYGDVQSEMRLQN